MLRKIRIAGTGCALIDNLFNNVRFHDKEIQPYLSKNAGDGGLSPGKLVFTNEFEKFAGKTVEEVLFEVSGRKAPDTYNIGGPCIVALIHAAQLTNHLQTEVLFYGAMGNDVNGKNLRRLLSKTPLDINNFAITSNTTPYTNVISDPDFAEGHGERIFINNIGAAWDFTPEHLDESFFAADICVFGGTALVPNIHDHLKEVLFHAKECGRFTVVNTVYDFRNEQRNPHKQWPMGENDHSYELIDLLITDYEEAIRLSGKSTIEGAMEFFIDKKTGAVIITHGANPITIYSSGRSMKTLPVSQLPVSERVKNELKMNSDNTGDTTGCGDNFVGGILASFVTQMQNEQKPDLIEACAWGVASGGFACFYLGGTYFEKTLGEKSEKIKAYYQDYMNQIKNK